MAIGTGAAILGASALSTGASLGSSLLSAGLGYNAQKNLAKHSYKLNLETSRNNPSAYREGLEKAGINPMLAVSNGTIGANSNFSSSPQNYNFADSLTSGVANAQSFQRLANETKQADSVVDLNDSTASKNLAETSEIMERLPFVGAQAKANLQKTQAETTQLNALSENYKARLELDRMLGLMGIDTTRRGQDLSYNASKYASNISEVNNIRTNQTLSRRQGIRILGSGLDWYHP